MRIAIIALIPALLLVACDVAEPDDDTCVSDIEIDLLEPQENEAFDKYIQLELWWEEAVAVTAYVTEIEEPGQVVEDPRDGDTVCDLTYYFDMDATGDMWHLAHVNDCASGDGFVFDCDSWNLFEVVAVDAAGCEKVITFEAYYCCNDCE